MDTQTIEFSELSKRYENALKKSQESSKIKDQLEEFKHLSDRLSQSEALNEKLKKKLEDYHDLKKKLKLIEEENTNLKARQEDLLTDLKRSAGYKQTIDSYKQQIQSLQETNFVLQQSKTSDEGIILELNTKLEKLSVEKKGALELIGNLEDRLRDIENGILL